MGAAAAVPIPPPGNDIEVAMIGDVETKAGHPPSAAARVAASRELGCDACPGSGWVAVLIQCGPIAGINVLRALALVEADPHQVAALADVNSRRGAIDRVARLPCTGAWLWTGIDPVDASQTPALGLIADTQAGVGRLMIMSSRGGDSAERQPEGDQHQALKAMSTGGRHGLRRAQ